MSGFDKRWHVMYTRPKFEKKILKALNDKGIEAFLPLHNVIRQWHDRKKKLEVPMFPNYVFVHIDTIQIYDIYTIPGFVRFVNTGGNLDIVSKKKMAMIMNILENDFETIAGEFVIGERVKISSGPFMDLEGVLIGEKGNHRFAVEIEAINQYVVTSVNPGDIIKLDENVELV